MSYRRDVNDDPYSDGLSNGYGSYDKAQRVAAPTYLDRRGAQRRSPERDRTREHTRQVSGQIGERQVEGQYSVCRALALDTVQLLTCSVI